MSPSRPSQNVAPTVLFLGDLHGDERQRLLETAESAGLHLVLEPDPAALLARFAAAEADGVVLPLGDYEEESILACRALRKRHPERDVTIAFVARGGTLVESLDEARDVGADELLPNLPPAELFAQLRALLDVPVVTVLGADEDVPLPAVEPGHDDAALEGLPGEAARPPGSATPGTALEPASALSGEVRAKLDHVRYADYFAILEVDLDADADRIYAAYVRLSRRFEPGRAVSPLDRLGASEIVEALDDAWYVLGDTRLRARYRDALVAATGR